MNGEATAGVYNPSFDGIDGFGTIVGSAVISIQPQLSGFRWRLYNEIRDMRWETLVWLVGERFTLELSDLDNAVLKYRPVNY